MRILIFLLSTLFFINGFAKSPVAFVLSIHGGAVVQKGEKRALNLGSKLYVGDVIETSKNSFITVLFKDKTKFYFGQNTSFIIHKYHFSNEKEVISSIEVKKGVFSFIAGKIAKISPENFEVFTETATVGIRGSAGFGIYNLQNKKRFSIAPIKGHILEVTTYTSNRYILENDQMTLFVDQTGRGKLLPFERSSLLHFQKTFGIGGDFSFVVEVEKEKIPFFPVKSERSPIFIYYSREEVIKFGMRRYKVTYLLEDNPLKNLQLNSVFDQMKKNQEIRDVSTEKETASTPSFLKDLGKKTRQEALYKKQEKILSEEKKDPLKKEIGSSMNVMEKLSKEMSTSSDIAKVILQKKEDKEEE